MAVVNKFLQSTWRHAKRIIMWHSIFEKLNGNRQREHLCQKQILLLTLICTSYNPRAWQFRCICHVMSLINPALSLSLAIHKYDTDTVNTKLCLWECSLKISSTLTVMIHTYCQVNQALKCWVVVDNVSKPHEKYNKKIKLNVIKPQYFWKTEWKSLGSTFITKQYWWYRWFT